MTTIYTPSSIDENTERQLWESAIFVFDTSALLDFYYMTEESQEIIADIFNYMSDRIWLPAQVYYEFHKNRDCAMRKPITEKYCDKDLQSNKLIADLVYQAMGGEILSSIPFRAKTGGDKKVSGRYRTKDRRY